MWRGVDRVDYRSGDDYHGEARRYVVFQTRARNSIRQPSPRELNSQRTRNEHGRQHGRVITRELATRKTERDHPQHEPEQNEITSVTKLATEQQRQTNQKSEHRQQR